MGCAAGYIGKPSELVVLRTLQPTGFLGNASQVVVRRYQWPSFLDRAIHIHLLRLHGPLPSMQGNGPKFRLPN